MVTCIFLGPISLLIAPNSAIYSEVTVKTDISQLLLLICASEKLCIFVFFSSRFLLHFFSRLLAGSKVGFSVLPLALLLCRQMRILTSFIQRKLQHDCFLHELCSPMLLGFLQIMSLGVVPADALLWPVTGLMTDFYHKIYIVSKDLITTGPVRVFDNCLDKSSDSFIEIGV